MAGAKREELEARGRSVPGGAASRPPLRSYAGFGLGRSLRQLRFHLGSGGGDDERARVLLERLRRDEARIAEALGRPLEGTDVLEIGPGPLQERGRYLGLRNRVTALDLEPSPSGFDPAAYLGVLRRNGPARLAKTLGRKLLGVDRRRLEAWRRTIGADALPRPELLHGDIAAECPGEASFDAIVSWSVFEHLPDPEAALANSVRSLRPGGVLFVSIHLYTSHTGHHDIRAFSGGAAELPPWAHLRPGARDAIRPSSYLNEWRIADWRALFARRAPGAREYADRHGEARLRKRLSEELRRELAGYSDEELFTVDLAFAWRKPAAAAEEPRR